MYEIEPTGSRDTGVCDCCGHMSRCAWGGVYAESDALASYFVHWTIGQVPDHGAHFDLIMGRWGDGTSAADRFAVSLEYRLLDTGLAFMVVDADDSQVAESDLVGRALARSEVVGQPIAQDVFAVCDAILAQDPRLAELLGDEDA